MVRRSRNSSGRARTFSQRPPRIPAAFLNSAVAISFSYTASNRKLRRPSVASRMVVAHPDLGEPALERLDAPRR